MLMARYAFDTKIASTLQELPIEEPETRAGKIVKGIGVGALAGTLIPTAMNLGSIGTHHLASRYWEKNPEIAEQQIKKIMADYAASPEFKPYDHFVSRGTTPQFVPKGAPINFGSAFMENPTVFSDVNPSSFAHELGHHRDPHLTEWATKLKGQYNHTLRSLYHEGRANVSAVRQMYKSLGWKPALRGAAALTGAMGTYVANNPWVGGAITLAPILHGIFGKLDGAPNAS